MLRNKLIYFVRILQGFMVPSANIMRYAGMLCILFSLTGCVAAFIAGGAAATGLVVYDRRPVKLIEEDVRIARQINQAIAADRQFSDSRVVVVSFNRMVLLLGEMHDTALKMRIQNIAQGTPGVRRVYDEMRVGYPIALDQKTRDALITTQVRSRMILEKGLQSGSIRIVTEDGVVYLMGVVTPVQSAVAVHVARQVNGVRKVVKVFVT